MIVTIMLILFLVLALGVPIFDYIKNRETGLFMIPALTLLPVLVLSIVMLSDAYTSPDKQSLKNGLTYKEISYLAEHYDELSTDKKVEVSHNVDEWNSSLNTLNNYWCRFTIADYSSYIITIEDEIEL